jgi:hypothetical protein
MNYLKKMKSRWAYVRVRQIRRFIEDIGWFLQQDNTTCLTINEVCLVILLFAGDMVTCGDFVEDLQSTPNFLREYCDKWGL